MKPGELVLVGPLLIVTLKVRVGMIKGVGQMWRTLDDRFIASSTDVRGTTSWSILTNPDWYIQFYAAQDLFVPEPSCPLLSKFLDINASDLFPGP